VSNFGFNLLSVTQSVIGRQAYQYIEWLGTVTNDQGYNVDSFSDPVERKAGIYPMNRESIQRNGLDFDKQYIQIYDTELVRLLSSGSNADRLVFNGYLWRALPTANDWQPSGGWNQVMAVKLEPYNA
jgi:hypothetical protein